MIPMPPRRGISPRYRCFSFCIAPCPPDGMPPRGEAAPLLTRRVRGLVFDIPRPGDCSPPLGCPPFRAPGTGLAGAMALYNRRLRVPRLDDPASRRSAPMPELAKSFEPASLEAHWGPL